MCRLNTKSISKVKYSLAFFVGTCLCNDSFDGHGLLLSCLARVIETIQLRLIFHVGCIFKQGAISLFYWPAHCGFDESGTIVQLPDVETA